MNTFDLSLDLSKSRNVNPIRLRQGDLNGTTIRALIFDHGALADLSGTTARWVMRLPGGEEYYRKTATVDATASTVTVEVDETQAASVSGRCRGYFQILDGSTVIASTGDVLVEVLPDALEGATVAESYDTAIQDAIDDLNDAIEAIPDTVEDVLEAHPEWVTTVQDGAVTDAKLYQGAGGILSRNARLMYRLDNLLTHRTDEGTLAAISDAAKTPVAGLSVYGLSTQDGTPTPSAPVPIVSVEGDSEGNISLKAQGLNVAHPIAGTYSNKGITATVAEDGWITISGTSTATASSLIGFGIGTTENTARVIEGAPSFALYIENEGALVSGEVELQVYGSNGESVTQGATSTVSRFFTMLTDYISRIVIFLRAASNGKTYSGRFRFSLVRSDQIPAAYIPYVETVTPIDLDGHELRSLPDGTRDELTVDAEGHAVLVQRVQLTTQAVTDGVTGTVGVDVMSSTGEIANGATVLYPLATPVTHDLGTVPLVPLVGPDLTAQTVPTAPFVLDAERDLNATLARLEAALAALA